MTRIVTAVLQGFKFYYRQLLLPYKALHLMVHAFTAVLQGMNFDDKRS